MQKRIRLSSRAEIAVQCLIVMAKAKPGQNVPLSTMSDIASVSYLEQIFSDLRQAKIVKSFRGPGGGYKLARAAKFIDMASVYHAASGRRGDTGRPDADLEGLRGRIERALYNELSVLTLADVMQPAPAAVSELRRAA